MRIRFTFLIISLFLMTCCNSFKTKQERTIVTNGNSCYLIGKNDSIRLGNIFLNRDLFKEMTPNFYPEIQYDGVEPLQAGDVYYQITGIYINSRIFNCFNFEDGKPKKMQNDFDIIFIYPEISRYNFQFSNIMGYRVFHYYGSFYQEPSSSENLPYHVKSIIKTDNNSLLMIYRNNSDFIPGEVIDTFKLTTYPQMKIGFMNPNEKIFQQTEEYFKLSEELSNIELSIPIGIYPQDMNELFLREIITNLINLKFDTKHKTNEIIEKLD